MTIFRSWKGDCFSWKLFAHCLLKSLGCCGVLCIFRVHKNLHGSNTIQPRCYSPGFTHLVLDRHLRIVRQCLLMTKTTPISMVFIMTEEAALFSVSVLFLPFN